jgi:hypothetical protein
MRSYHRLKEQKKEKIKYGGLLDGDFNSNASAQSWGEFFTMFSVGGLGLAVGSELSTWHGERKLISYNRILGVITDTKDSAILQLPENYKVSLINSGMKSSDFIEGVKSDEKGEYYETDIGPNKWKFYLPSSEFFSKFSDNIPYKFETETGDVYSLVLQLKSGKDVGEASMGATNVEDDLSISLSNANPTQGNGWFFMLPPDLSGQVFEYYKTIAGVRVAFDLNVMGQSVKSSFQLWWEQWGVVVQIVASIVLSFFTGGLSLGIQGLFRSGVLASPRILTWLTAQGGFNVARSKILAFFILESAVNLPSAWIDYSFDNKFGAFLGIMFCIFPFASNYGKIGRWVKGKYTDDVAESMCGKLLRSGLNQNSTKEQVYEFIVGLSAEEKMMWVEGMKLLKTKQGAKTIEETLSEIMSKFAKENPELPTKFMSWLKTSGLEAGKTLALAAAWFVTWGGLYIGVEYLAQKNNDERDMDTIASDAQTSADTIKEKFPISDELQTIEIPNTFETMQSIFDKQKENKSASDFYNLSKKDEKWNNYFTQLVAEEKANAIRKVMKESAKTTAEADKIMDEVINAVKELNPYLLKEKKIKDSEIASWVSPKDVDEKVLTYISDYSSDPMSNEIAKVTKKNKCISTNFEYIDGFPRIGNEFALKFKVNSPITIKYKSGEVMKPFSLKSGQILWIYEDNSFTVDGKDYVDFTCS